MATNSQSIRHWLQPKNWSKLSENDFEVSDNKKNIFFSQLCVLGAAFTILQSLNEVFEPNVYLLPLDIASFLMWPLARWLNEKGRHTLAKVIMIGYLNTIFFLLSCLLDPSVKFELLFYPLIILSFMTLGNKEKWIAIFFGVLSVSFLLTLSLTNNKPFGDIIIQAPRKIDELLNIFTAAFFTGACAVFIINLHTRVEKSLREKGEELSKANEELDRFVYSASHDMRAPLTSIQGLVDLALIENKETPSAQYLDLIRNRAVKLDDLITDITNYSRNNRLSNDVKEVNLNGLLDEALEKIKFIEGVNEIEITKSIIGEQLAKLDASRVTILINNLLTNAVKYYDPSKSNPWIKISIENGQSFKFKIEDNGIGISEKHHDKIFQMFYRATPDSQGSGLGLYIVKEIVTKLNGTISFSSAPKQGTTFEVTLPI